MPLVRPEDRLVPGREEATEAIITARRAKVASDAMIPVAARLSQKATDLLASTPVAECVAALLAPR